MPVWAGTIDGAPVAMHVAKTANVHQNVKAQRLPRGEFAQQLVMASAMTQAEVDDLVALGLVQRSDVPPNLPVGIVTLPVE